jgi:DNA-directed RNA polymerase alpha subunit
MKITNVKKKNRDSIQFIWNNPKQHVIHAIQRSAISDVPTLCIDMVMVDENTSMMADQELALRLGLIPVESTIASEFLMPDECNCENFCNQCSIKMTLNVSCYDEKYDVTSKDLYCEDIAGIGHRPRARPVHESSLPDKFLGEDGFGPGILLVTLIKNQSIRLSCIVRKGTGKIHGKWNPTSKITFVPLPVVNINMKKYDKLNETMELKLRQDIENDLRTRYEPKCKKYLEPLIRKEVEDIGGDEQFNDEMYRSMLSDRTKSMLDSIINEHLETLVEKNKIDWKKKWVDSCPRGVFKGIDDIEDISSIDDKWWTPGNNNQCIVCNACIREAEDVLEVDNLITVGCDENNFTCQIFGTGVMDPREILLRSIKQLKVKLVGLQMEMANLSNSLDPDPDDIF